jgi:Leucine-rich repeat (LRR) protein
VAELIDLKNLLKLTIRQNLLDKLVFPRLPSLEELNIEANKIASFKEFDNLKVLLYKI